MSKFVVSVAVICGLLIVVFLVMFVMASLEMSLGAGLRAVAGTLWGVTTLADLGVGLVFVAGWIAVIERNVLRAAPWIIAMFLLGNFTLLVYLLVRSRRVTTVTELYLKPRASAAPASS